MGLIEFHNDQSVYIDGRTDVAKHSKGEMVMASCGIHAGSFVGHRSRPESVMFILQSALNACPEKREKKNNTGQVVVHML